MWKGFSHLLKKDVRMMLSGRFFLLAAISLVLYSCYINFMYLNTEQEDYPIYLYDPHKLYSAESEYITHVNDRQELETACADGYSIGIDYSGDVPEIYMLSSGIDTMDRYRTAWAETVLTGKVEEEADIIGIYNKEQKSRREITAEFLFFEISAVGFLGLASVLFKEKQMGAIRVHAILPVRKTAFIISKLSMFLLSDLIFAIALTWINVGLRDSFAILPSVLVQAGILSLIMALAGFFCAVRLPDFKQFSLFYLVLAVFVTTPVFLAGQTGFSWSWISYHPMYYLFTAIKDAYFGSLKMPFVYYLVCFGTIAVLFGTACRVLSREMEKEG